MSLDQFSSRFRRDFGHLLGGRLLVALSGGADSVALLHLLRDPSLSIELVAAHVHHGSRGDEADRDARFCQRLCADVRVPFHLLRIQIEVAPAEGREAAWRRHRYDTLQKLALELGANAIATAHHRDDVAEGVLVQLLRGAGPRAMAGIEAETAEGVVRPLLPWRRREIVAWLREQGIEWVEDSSNADLGHLRNRVRHEALPGLRRIEPRIDDHLVHLAGLLAEDQAFFTEELAVRDAWIRPWHPDGGVPIDSIRALPVSLRSRWLHAQASRCGLGRISRRQTELVLQLVDSGSPRAVTLPDRWVLRLAAGDLWLEPPQTPSPYDLEIVEGRDLELPIPGWRLRTGGGDTSGVPEGWSWSASRTARLRVRSPRPGDEVHGAEGPVKVAKLLARAAPRHLRRRWPVLCENARITWIPGVWQGPCEGELPVEVQIDG